MSEYAGTHFELPNKPTIPQESENQTIVLNDNCKDTTTATITNVGNITPADVSALLTLYAGSVYATSITQSTLGGPLTLQFPTPTSFPEDDIQKACSKIPNTVPPSGAAPTPIVLPFSAKLVLSEEGDTRWGSGGGKDPDDI